MVPLEPKNLRETELFKSEIRKWESRQCECKLCLPYVHNICYVNISNTTLFLKHQDTIPKTRGKSK